MAEPQRTITLRSVITHATRLLQEHGDLPVWIHDADTDWALGIAFFDAGRPHEQDYTGGVYLAGHYYPSETDGTITLGRYTYPASPPPDAPPLDAAPPVR